jgi:N6-adenosine-specific RNA methylase IME4
MTLEEITALPVEARAAGDSVLWLWTTNAFLEESFAVCRAWGFQYRTTLTWGKNRIGLGDWLRGQTEHCLFASRGKPVVTLTAQGTLLLADVGKHSEKPDAFYELVEKICPAPDLGRLELFARRPRKGWRAWGAELNDSI